MCKKSFRVVQHYSYGQFQLACFAEYISTLGVIHPSPSRLGIYQLLVLLAKYGECYELAIAQPMVA